MNLLDKILECYPEEDLLTADGYDDAVIGIDPLSFRLIYSVKLVLELLMADGMSYEEAKEFFDFNIGGAYVGELTPIWCEDNF